MRIQEWGFDCVRRGAVVLPSFAVGLLLAMPARAATITVGSGCTVTQAIAAANGDTAVGSCAKGSGHDDIILGIGTYAVSTALDIRSDLTIVGKGMNLTIIESSSTASPGSGMSKCGASPAAVYVSASKSGAPLPVKFQALTIKPASGTVNRGLCQRKGGLYLHQVKVTGFPAGGVWAENDSGVPAHLDVEESWVDANFSSGSGGGIYFTQHHNSGGTSGSLHLSDSAVTSNFSGNCGGGVYVGMDSNVADTPFHTIDTTTISSNEALGDGGGVCQDINMASAYLLVNNTTIAQNYAAGIGGGAWKTATFSDFQLERCLIVDNTSGTDSYQDNLNYHPTEHALTQKLLSVESVIYLQDAYLPGSPWTVDSVPYDDFYSEYASPDPNIAPLIGGGGLNNLPVHALLSGARAIDFTIESNVGRDQRGIVVLPAEGVDGDLNGERKYDVGAYEHFPFQFETESLFMAGKTSSAGHLVRSGEAFRGYSNYSGTTFNATAVGHYVVYRTAVVPAGTYSVIVRHNDFTNVAQFRVSTANSLSDSVNETGSYAAIGAVIDGYSPVDAYVERTLTAPVTYSSAGERFIKLKVTGKNAASSNYRIYPDYILFIQQ